MSEESAPALKEQLRAEIGTCLASDLMAHVKRGAVVVVDESLDLLEVACAVAEDNADRVAGWIKAEKLAPPSSQQVEAWEAAPESPCRSVVVQPYVLVRVLPST